MQEEGSTGSNEEEPADNIDTRMQTTLSFEEIDTHGGETMSQIELEMVGLIQKHRGDDKENTGSQIDKRRKGRTCDLECEVQHSVWIELLVRAYLRFTDRRLELEVYLM